MPFILCSPLAVINAITWITRVRPNCKLIPMGIHLGGPAGAAEIVRAGAAKAMEMEEMEEGGGEWGGAAGSANRSGKRPAIFPWSTTEALPAPATTPALIPATPLLPAAPQVEIDNDTDQS